MVEEAARRSRLIADGGRSEKKRDAEGGGESGEGSSTVLYIVPGARQITALRDAKPGRGGGLAGRACLHTATQVSECQDLGNNLSVFSSLQYHQLWRGRLSSSGDHGTSETLVE